MDFSGDVWDLNDIKAKLEAESDRAGDSYGENLVQAIKHIERAVGFLEEADRVQPLLKAVK